MRKMDQYLSTADTLYPDGYERERVFRDAGDMVAPAPFPAKIARTLIGRLIAGMALWFQKRRDGSLCGNCPTIFWRISALRGTRP